MRIAGIDYGTIRIGIALADTEVGIAGPFENYTRRSPALDAEHFATLAAPPPPAIEVAPPVPIKTPPRRSPALDAEHFATLAKEERIGRFVVGLPVHLHGGESQKSAEARKFGDWLGTTTNVPVEYFD